MWGPAAYTGLPMGFQGLSRMSTAPQAAFGQESLDVVEDPLAAQCPLTELGSIALIKFNTVAARYASNRLYDEGLCTFAELREVVTSEEKEAVIASARTLAETSPAPLVAPSVLSFIFSYVYDNSEISENDQQTIQRLLQSQSNGPVGGRPPPDGLPGFPPPGPSLGAPLSSSHAGRPALGHAAGSGCTGAASPAGTGCPVPGLAFPPGRPGAPRFGPVAVDVNNL